MRPTLQHVIVRRLAIVAALALLALAAGFAWLRAG